MTGQILMDGMSVLIYFYLVQLAQRGGRVEGKDKAGVVVLWISSVYQQSRPRRSGTVVPLQNPSWRQSILFVSHGEMVGSGSRRGVGENYNQSRISLWSCS